MTSIIRHQDWEDRLRTYLDRVKEDKFEWGTHDCALFSADCVNAMTGVDPAEVFRGTYDTARGAAEALRTHGGGTLLRTMRQWFGEALESVHQAQRGDLVMLDRFTVGVCAGRYSWFVGREQGQEGLTIHPTASCRHAFRVPFEAA